MRGLWFEPSSHAGPCFAGQSTTKKPQVSGTVLYHHSVVHNSPSTGRVASPALVALTLITGLCDDMLRQILQVLDKDQGHYSEHSLIVTIRVVTYPISNYLGC